MEYKPPILLPPQELLHALASATLRGVKMIRCMMRDVMLHQTHALLWLDGHAAVTLQDWDDDDTDGFRRPQNRRQHIILARTAATTSRRKYGRRSAHIVLAFRA